MRNLFIPKTFSHLYSRWILTFTLLIIASCNSTKFPEIIESHPIPIGQDIDLVFEWLPDHPYVVYVQDEKEVVVFDYANGQKQVISPLESNFIASSPRWSPDGKLIAYRLRDTAPECFSRGQAFREHLPFSRYPSEVALSSSSNRRNGRQEKRRLGSKWHVDQSSDHLILGKDGPSNPDCFRTVIYDLKLRTSYTILAGAYSWSPDGKFLAGRVLIDNTIQFAVVRVNDGHIIYQNENFPPFVLGAAALPYNEFVWSPNSRYIVYAASIHYSDQAVLVDIQTGSETILEAANSEHFSWAPDSERLAFFRIDYRDVLDVHIYDVNAKKTWLLTRVDLPIGSYSWPAWSPNGLFLALSADTGADTQEGVTRGFNDLVLVNTKSGEFRKYQIVEIIDSVQWLQWGADSQHLYVSGVSSVLELAWENGF